MSFNMRNCKLCYYVFLLFFGTISMTILANSADNQRRIKFTKSTQLVPSQVLPNCTLSAQEKGQSNRKPEEIRKLLQSIVEGKRAVGIAVGLVTPEGHCIITAGSSGKSARPQIDGDTMFELGSITKALTGALLADMMAKGELNLDEPIGPYLPKAAQGNAALAAITFRQLTTHSAGLSRVPMTMAFAKAGFTNPNDPYANYSEADLVADLANMKPDKDAKYAYSNTGGALLGMLLANRSGESYSKLVQARLLNPIGMSATSLVHAKDDDVLAAQPHDASLKPTVGWNLGVFVPTGGARSNVNDMMKLIDANLARKTPWVHSHEQLAPLGKVGGIAYNWHIARLLSNIDGKEKRDALVWHNGGTFGSTSFVGFDIERGIGVVVLINTGAIGLADEIAMHMWDTRNAPPSAIVEKKSVSGLAAFLIAGVVFASATLALRAHATLQAHVAQRARAKSSATETQTAARPRSWWRTKFLTPFTDRVELLYNVFASTAATLFILKFVPIIPLFAGFGVHLLLMLVLVCAIVHALWAARVVTWRVARTLWRWLALFLGTMLNALFLWFAL
jgi:CubicO group peptidase (beta-lactamase class C family)